jgi:hypothetical protein
MSIYAGLDVSDKTTHVCLVDSQGTVKRRDVVASVFPMPPVPMINIELPHRSASMTCSSSRPLPKNDRLGRGGGSLPLSGSIILASRSRVAEMSFDFRS